MQISPRLTPEDLNELFIAACEEQQQGELEKARKKYLLLLQHVPDAPLLLYNLGLIHYQEGDYELAETSFRRALALSPEDMDALFNLALSQKKCGKIEAAISSYRNLLSQEPDNIDALYNLGGCYKDIGQYKKAADLYRNVLKLDPAHFSANNNAAYVFHCLGQFDQARYYYEKVLELEPDHSGANHMLNALFGRESNAVLEAYVKHLFDGYSGSFDHSLGTMLQYRVPENLLGLYKELRWEKSRFQRGLDLGCGTGLCGQLFSERISEFTGVDISSKMIAQAAAKNIYDRLETENITAYLKKTSNKYDFFLAADVLGYVGELTELFELIKNRAEPACLFGFSTEDCPGEGFILTPSGRFAHSPGYVRRLAEKTGWSLIAGRSSVLRKERGEWVPGMIWFMTVAGN